MELFHEFAVALSVGLLIGFERGWHGRLAEEGQRIAGIRTFGLISLLGGVWTLLGQEMGELLLGFGFLGFAGVLIAAHIVGIGRARDYGITTVVAALLAFALGGLAVRGHMAVAGALAVVATLLLGLKPELHRWLRHVEKQEVLAALKLLLISVVLLPVLPNRGYGPWDTLNPYEIWWLVVLIAAIGFVGYVAIRLLGPRLGSLATGLLGGLASSTAVTLNFSRMGKKNAAMHSVLAAGIVAAAATMFPRVLLEVSVVHPELLERLWIPMVVMTAISYASVPWLWRLGRRDGGEKPQMALPNPFELKPALQFGALLVAIMLLSKALQVWFGDTGVYLLALLSGITDVDAITLSLARLSRESLDMEVAARGIVIAAVTNTLAKSALVMLIAGGAMGWRVGVVFGATAIGGLTALMLAPAGIGT